MPELNKAKRQVCDVIIRELATMHPYFNFETANTTTAGITGSSVYAKKKGANAIGFQDQIAGTMTIEAQVLPFKMLAMFSDGTIESEGLQDIHVTVEAKTAGKLTFTLPNGATFVSGTLFVYPEGEYGDESKLIKGTLATNVFTATTSGEIEVGKKYVVGSILKRTSGVRKISINNKKLPKDFYITQSTVEKDESGNITPFNMIAYKAVLQRNLDMSFSSEGDPQSITFTFDLQEDKDGNVFDMLEITDEAEITVA